MGYLPQYVVWGMWGAGAHCWDQICPAESLGTPTDLGKETATVVQQSGIRLRWIVNTHRRLHSGIVGRDPASRPLVIYISTGLYFTSRCLVLIEFYARCHLNPQPCKNLTMTAPNFKVSQSRTLCDVPRAQRLVLGYCRWCRPSRPPASSSSLAAWHVRNSPRSSCGARQPTPRNPLRITSGI